MFQRSFHKLEDTIEKNKVTILYWPRRVGKTTLLDTFLKEYKQPYELLSWDNIRIQELLSSQDFSRILPRFTGLSLLAIDEAQNIPNIGQWLKILIDNIPDITIIATGSSSFELSQHIGEPLTGRKKTLTLYPLSLLELQKIWKIITLEDMMERFLIYGMYPEVLTTETLQKKQDKLNELVDSYILKDILALKGIRSPKVLLDLLKLLAFQIGNLVSLNELATQLGIDTKTVGKYIDLLEKTFIIKKLSGFSGNLRNWITSKCKYYFVDLGIRNSIIQQYNTLDNRNDKWQLWENFVIMEYIKKHIYTRQSGNLYFWRNYKGAEIDLIREYDGKLDCYECKWTKNTTIPEDFVEKYGKQKFSTITTENWFATLL